MTESSAQSEATYCCYAKVNFILRVIRKRPDGYHDIDSLMQTVDLADAVRVRWGGTGIKVSCSDPELAGEANLVWKAASLFRETVNIEEGLHISITKRIPVAAGLGGGSSDAACVLNAMAQRHGVAAGSAWLSRLALEVGSDVPYLLTGGLARVRGRGEIVDRLPGTRPLDLVVATPPVRINSSWAYGQLRMRLTGAGRGDSMFTFDTAAAGGQSLAAALHNDLERVVSRTFLHIPRLKERLKSMGALGAVMSGSGPSVLAIVNDRAQAEDVAARLRAEGYAAFAVRTTGSGHSACE